MLYVFLWVCCAGKRNMGWAEKQRGSFDCPGSNLQVSFPNPKNILNSFVQVVVNESLVYVYLCDYRGHGRNLKCIAWNPNRKNWDCERILSCSSKDSTGGKLRSTLIFWTLDFQTIKKHVCLGDLCLPVSQFFFQGSKLGFHLYMV